MFNAMTQAFANTHQFPLQVTKHGKQFKEGWSAKLSFKTYNALKAQGIMA